MVDRTEKMVINEETGGVKATKKARFGLIPYRALWALAEHYAVGSEKYTKEFPIHDCDACSKLVKSCTCVKDKRISEWLSATPTGCTQHMACASNAIKSATQTPSEQPVTLSGSPLSGDCAGPAMTGSLRPRTQDTLSASEEMQKSGTQKIAIESGHIPRSIPSCPELSKQGHLDSEKAHSPNTDLLSMMKTGCLMSKAVFVLSAEGRALQGCGSTLTTTMIQEKFEAFCAQIATKRWGCFEMMRTFSKGHQSTCALAAAKIGPNSITIPGDYNWTQGYDWHLSFDALQRHFALWMMGEKNDPETGSHHMICVAWHAFALFIFETFGLGKDDRGPLRIEDESDG